MEKNEAKVYSELYGILELLGSEYKRKLPSELMEMIKLKKDNSYNPQYTFSKNINEQGISKKTLELLTVLNLYYWCSNGEKEKIIKKLKENEEKYNLKPQIVSNELFEKKKSLNEKKLPIEHQKDEIKAWIVKKENFFEECLEIESIELISFTSIDIQKLISFKKLKRLYIYNSNIINSHLLKEFGNLQHLKLDGSKLDDENVLNTLNKNIKVEKKDKFFFANA